STASAVRRRRRANRRTAASKRWHSADSASRSPAAARATSSATVDSAATTGAAIVDMARNGSRSVARADPPKKRRARVTNAAVAPLGGAEEETMKPRAKTILKKTL